MNAESKCPYHHKLRPGLPPLTQRISVLPVDERGYPIPYFVGKDSDGKYDFRFMDGEKLIQCHLENRCWVCGQPLGGFKAFIIGPMCSITRTTSEPPSHLDCAEWSLKACPFLTKPKMERREDEKTEASKDNVAGIQIRRNPGVMSLWICKQYRIFFDHQQKPLFTVGDPESVSWWSEGREATREEVLESVNSGLPFLEDACQGERTPLRVQGARDSLKRHLLAAEKFYPAPRLSVAGIV